MSIFCVLIQNSFLGAIVRQFFKRRIIIVGPFGEFKRGLQLYNMRQLEEAVKRGDEARIIQAFRIINKGVTGDFHNCGPCYSIRQDDVFTIVQPLLMGAGIKTLALTIKDDGDPTFLTLLSCVAGAVDTEWFAESILEANAIDLGKISINSNNIFLYEAIQKEECDGDVWNQIAAANDKQFETVLYGAAKRMITMRNATIKAVFLRRCLYWFNSRIAHPKLAFFLWLIQNRLIIDC